MNDTFHGRANPTTASPPNRSSTQGDPAQSEPPRIYFLSIPPVTSSGPRGRRNHDGDWRSYGNGPANANRVSSGVPEADDYEVLASGGWPYTPPVVQGGVVYFAAGRRVVAVTPAGDEQWERRLDIEVSGAPALDPNRNRLYVPTRVVRTSDAPDPVPASVTALSLADGTERWRQPLDPLIYDEYNLGDSGCITAGDGVKAHSPSLPEPSGRISGVPLR